MGEEETLLEPELGNTALLCLAKDPEEETQFLGDHISVPSQYRRPKSLYLRREGTVYVHAPYKSQH